MGNIYIIRMYTLQDLTSRERQIIYGTLIGDAYIHIKYPERSNVSLVMSRQVAHRDYMEWFLHELDRFTPTLKEYTSTDTHMTQYLGNNVRHQIQVDPYEHISLVLRTSSKFPVWRQLHTQFYGDSRKKIHIPIEELTPLALAVLWQDDGTTNMSYYSYGRLNVQGFPLSERELLQQYLEETYDMKTVIIKTGELGFGKRSLDILASTIKPHMLPMFYYKLGWKYAEEDCTRL